MQHWPDLPNQTAFGNWRIVTPSSQPTLGQSFIVPQGASHLYFFACAPGGGGGGGRTGAAGTARGGGGSGAGGAFAKIIIPTVFLPPKLHFSPGLGGAGGAANGNGTAGQQLIIADPNGNVLLTLNGGGAGNAGATSGIAAGGTTNGPARGANLFMQIGIIQSAGGGAGGGGGNASGTAGNNSVANGGPSVGGGSGGGCGTDNVDRNGGQVSATANWPIVPMASPSPNLPLGPPWMIYPGAGGNGTNGVAGAGQDAGYGMGGGGGGGGTTGGPGGRGGDGYCLLCWW